MKKIAMVILMAALSGQQALAVNDIKCTISKVGTDLTREVVVKDKSIPDFDNKWSKFDLRGPDEMALACTSFSNDMLRCGVLISAKGELNKDFGTLEQLQRNGIWVASDGLIELITKNYSVVCSSVTLFGNRSVKATGPEKLKARTLSEDELNFCERFRKRSETLPGGINGDNRLLCVSTLQVLEKPVPLNQLNFCAQFDRDGEGFGVDTRLNCILKVSSGS